MSGSSPRGRWRASVRESGQWTDVRVPTRPYRRGSLVEWGSITKGLLGTAAAKILDTTRPLVDLLPEYPSADFTVDELIRHRSGLPRLPAAMEARIWGDPYRPTVGRRIEAADLEQRGPCGEYLYSNLGYALLGTVLDRASGDWFDAVRATVLVPAGISSATLDPPSGLCVVPKLFGRAIQPWQMAGSVYAASGGVWSSFEDLCRYAEWALEDGAPSHRTVAWQREAATTWINGEVRAAGAAIVQADGVIAVAHALAQRPGAADRIATGALAQRLRGRAEGNVERSAS
jgi:CubicO group peptidase (beta-lactamase class C family)